MVTVRDGRFDVLIATGPRVAEFPSIGARVISQFCSEMGLVAGFLGGEALTPRGVIPLPGIGGLVVAQDIQNRIHRLKARAVVKLSPPSEFPNPFPGWRLSGLVPLSTAHRLWKEGSLAWDPMTVVFGSGNRALRFGSQLLESGVGKVLCVETSPERWGGKRFAGWEVERRRFEILGGSLIEAKPVSLAPKSPLVWELRLEDSQGVRILEVARVVSAGPFTDSPGIREFPPGSMLFELDQTALGQRAFDVEGWDLEEDRARLLGCKITKALLPDLGAKKDDWERVFRRAKNRLRKSERHREVPFTPTYQGKWLGRAESQQIRAFEGVPKERHRTAAIASIECFEEIGCNLCEKSCPVGAITGRAIKEADCTSCGLCLSACPSQAIVMVKEPESASNAQLVIPSRAAKAWKPGEFAILLNRKGQTLGTTGRVVEILPKPETARPDDLTQWVKVELPAHLVWEARGIRRSRAPAAEDEAFLAAERAESRPVRRVEISINGERRLVREKLPLSLALFEIGASRPQDGLLCSDGSCGLCALSVDGVRLKACQTEVRKGMAIKVDAPSGQEDFLCPCLGITRAQVEERIVQGKLESPESVLAATHVGEGKCHGQLCMDAFRRIAGAQDWIDWRFPWSEWVMAPAPHE